MNTKIDANETARILGITAPAVARLVARGLLHPVGELFERNEVAALAASRRAIPTAARSLPGDNAGRLAMRSGRTTAI
jgi:hypothetical protein